MGKNHSAESKKWKIGQGQTYKVHYKMWSKVAKGKISKNSNHVGKCSGLLLARHSKKTKSHIQIITNNNKYNKKINCPLFCTLYTGYKYRLLCLPNLFCMYYLYSQKMSISLIIPFWMEIYSKNANKLGPFFPYKK